MPDDTPDLWTVAPEGKRRGVFAATSLNSNLPDQAKATQRRKIMDQLAAYGPQTYHDIAAATGIELSVVCWRMRELDHRGNGTVRYATNPDGSIKTVSRRRLVELAPSLRRSA